MAELLASATRWGKRRPFHRGEATSCYCKTFSLRKGTTVLTTSPEATLAEAVRQMCDHKVGSMLVCCAAIPRRRIAGGHCHGRRLAAKASPPANATLTVLTVAEVMTTKLITARPCDSVTDLMGVMTTHRIRHVPVLTEERLVGMVSIGDLLKSAARSLDGREPVHAGVYSELSRSRLPSGTIARRSGRKSTKSR